MINKSDFTPPSRYLYRFSSLPTKNDPRYFPGSFNLALYTVTYRAIEQADLSHKVKHDDQVRATGSGKYHVPKTKSKLQDDTKKHIRDHLRYGKHTNREALFHNIMVV